MKPAYELLGKPKLLVVDGAGTLFDPGSIAPAYAFQRSFNNTPESKDKLYGIEVALSTVMKYIGRDKLEHVKLLLSEQEVVEQFREKLGREPNEGDAQKLYKGFTEQIYPSAAQTEEIPGVKEAAFRLKEAGIPIVMTTGYDRTMVNEIRKKLPWLDDVLLASFTSSDVKKGRPAPYLIFHAMEAARIENAAYAINAGDTKVDTESADNAYMPGVVVLSGSITTSKEAKRINQEIERRHLIVPSLVDIINFTLDDTIVSRIRALNH